MKKCFFLFSIMILGILMMSFNILNDDEYEVSIYKNYISIANGTSNYSYYYDDADFYKLEQENDSYFYVIEFKDGMNVTILPSNNDYQLYGYIEDAYITFMNYLDSIDIDRLISNNEVECISVDDDRYYELFNVLNEYLKLDYNIRKQTEITTFDFKHVTSSQLEQITSTDEYVDNYVSNEYYEYVDKTDDDIVKIVPKDWFFSEGVHSYCGVEYYIYIETYKMEYEGIWIYRSEVFVADIDVTLPNVTDANGHYYNANGAAHTNSVVGIYINPVISNVYIGIETGNYNYINHVDDYLDEVVLLGANYRPAFQFSWIPKYLVVDTIGAYSEYLDSSWESPYIQYLDYEIDGIERNDSIDLSGMALDAYTALIGDLFSFIPGLGEAFDVFDHIKNLVEEYLAGNDSNPNADENCYNKTNVALESASFRYDFTSPDKPTNLIFAEIFDYLPFLIEEQALKYTYSFHVTGKSINGDGDELYSNSIRNEYLQVVFDLYDADGNVIDSSTEYECELLNVYNEENMSNDNLITLGNSLSFSYINGFEDPKTIKSNSGGKMIFKVPDDCYIKLVDTNGRILSSSISRHGHLKYIFMTLEAGKPYFLVGGTYSKNNKTFSITKETIGNLTYPNNMSYTYSISSNSSNNNLKCMSFNNSTYYGIYTINTSSYFDTQLYVYNEKGALLAFADDELYNSDDDPADYNASLYLPIGDYETIYIICTAINIYSSGQLTLSLSRWT